MNKQEQSSMPINHLINQSFNLSTTILNTFSSSETATNTECLQVIFRKVLADATIQLPNRLLIIYKHGDAVPLSVELIDSYLGRSKGSRSTGRCIRPASVCIPVTYIDQLRYSLRNSRSGDVYRAQLSEKLRSKLSEYIDALSLETNNSVAYARQTMRFSGNKMELS